ncbi:50S ribosomal protein L3 N(5)-glutamine methyltransferase [Rhodoferax sp. TH121]|uniref:50S ribosomal protein L3 N(5)-glutamine methyltransferase n=1 Tax=Rhodoferax sp. TH121 TaxID=2022803 RepID=UPI000B97B954|nr:50S ribosomal protein L3 N(5)-glutamine methyltransferase [Rhodoferax sp. TH121]OYQ40348.1 50S ribosomal protein L3 N(5)-glutamine methyltransferase [Rhodoferax sp. TH121]
MTLAELVAQAAQQLTDAHVSFGHGTTNARDEAAWLVLHAVGLPLDTPLDPGDLESNRPVAPEEYARAATLLGARISTRKPAAYLTNEAWLQGVPFYVDERVIVPRSLIAELLMDGSIDYWLKESTHRVLDLCTGNGSLGILAAMVYPEVEVTGADISADALAVARINVDKHQLVDRVQLVASDGLTAVQGPFDLILCNPPYVNAQSMAALPAEYLAEPFIALDGNQAGGSGDGMDFVRVLLKQAPAHMADDAVLVLEIGNERPFFEAAFPELEVVWLETSAGEDQVLLVTKEALLL